MQEIFSFEYSIPYLLYAIFFIFLTFNTYGKSNSENKIRLLCGFIYMFFFGLRGFVAYDWYAYYPYFQEANSIFQIRFLDFFEFIEIGEVVEPAFVIYTSVLKTLFPNWHLYIFVSSLIDFIVFDYVIRKYSPNYAFSFLILFAFNTSMLFDLLRNIKGLLFVLLSIRHIQERNLLKFSILIFIGFLFHRSILMFFPLYFYGHIKHHKKFLITLFVIFNILFFLDIPFFKILIENISPYLGESFESRFYWYSQNANYSQERGFTIGYLYRAATFLIIIGYINEMLTKYRYSAIFINMYLTYILMSFVLNDFDVFVFRSELLFGISFCFIWPMIIGVIRKNDIRISLLGIMVLICLFKTFKQTNNLMYEYENIIFGAKTYEERISTHLNNAYKIKTNK